MVNKITNFKVNRLIIAYLFISPFFILFLSFGVFPIIQSFYMSFRQNITVSRSVFVGLENYMELLQDKLFLKAAFNTVVIWIFAHLILLPGSFLFAYLLNNVITTGSGFFKSIIFTPAVTSTVAVALIFVTFFGNKTGLVNYGLRALHWNTIDFKGSNGIWLKPMIISLFVWRWFGYNTIIFLAGLSGIDPTLYDYAYVEGASRRQVLWFVTFPLMKPIFFFILFTSIVAGLQIYEEPYILAVNDIDHNLPGGLGFQGLCLAPYLYYHGFALWHFGYASSIAYIVVILAVVASAVSRKFFETDY